MLLILAGIAIMMLTGENGILTRAVEAKEKTIVGQEKESVELAYISAAIKKSGDNVTSEELQHELDLSVGANKTQVAGEEILDVLFTDTNHSYIVENGQIKKQGPVVNPYEPDEWVKAWVYPTTEGTWSTEIIDKALLPQNYNIIAKLYEINEPDAKYSLVIEGEGEMGNIFDVSDPENIKAYAWMDGFYSSSGPLFGSGENTGKVVICDGITNVPDNAFPFNTGIKSIKLSNSVTSIGGAAFYYCTNLTNIAMSNGVTSIGEFAFLGCSNLTSVKIPNGVTSIGEGTFQASGITSIKIPNSVTSIGDRAFEDCNYLTNVVMSSRVISIGYSVFGMCIELQSIEIPDGVTTIGENAFYYCSSLTNIEIPNSVTTIGNKAFCGCSGITSIEIPSSVGSIGTNAFGYCTRLTQITIHKAENLISGAKWGASDSVQVTWVE